MMQHETSQRVSEAYMYQRVGCMGSASYISRASASSYSTRRLIKTTKQDAVLAQAMIDHSYVFGKGVFHTQNSVQPLAKFLFDGKSQAEVRAALVYCERVGSV